MAGMTIPPKEKIGPIPLPQRGTRPTYLGPSMRNTLPLEMTTNPMEKIQYRIESQIKTSK